ncbi:MAG: hypothetical protein GC180_04860 [Bacteroidetes bacterium]|nr:hypothetical protein [Bacteroidota bacterium]
MKKIAFTGIVRYTGAEIGGWYLELEANSHEKLGIDPNARVMMELGEDTLHRGLRNSKNGYSHVALNKKLVDKYHLKEGMEVEIHLQEDRSEYGMDFPDEMREVMEQDPEGRDLFQRATPGLQRGLLHYVSSAKGVQMRINRALHLMTRVRELHAEGKIK